MLTRVCKKAILSSLPLTGERLVGNVPASHDATNRGGRARERVDEYSTLTVKAMIVVDEATVASEAICGYPNERLPADCFWGRTPLIARDSVGKASFFSALLLLLLLLLLLPETVPLDVVWPPPEGV